jgi:hypothetical protein
MRQMTDAAATAAAATPPTTPAPPSPPSTPAEAATRLAGLREDKSWTDKLLGGKDAATLAEFRSLSKLIAQGDPIDRAMSGETNLPDIGIDGQLSLAKVASAIPDLREHLSDGVIKELLSGRESTAAEIAAVKKFQSMRHSDKGWVDRYLKGEFEAVRESRLISAVLLAAPP